MSLLSLINRLYIKRKIFISYHHDNDQGFYNYFSENFSGEYEVVTDHSLDRNIDSRNSDYVIRTIREKYITGSSCTIVLCGIETMKRKFVDWEIKATLDAGHGLFGIILPTNFSASVYPSMTLPKRLYDNLYSNYSFTVNWGNVISNPLHLSSCINAAYYRSNSLINNSRQKKKYNG